jgi:cytochrome b6-f complex iron-sulfur subunit
MATIADLSGDEREQRAAELKRKMQEAAQKARAARGDASPSSGDATVTTTVEAPPAEAPSAEAAGATQVGDVRSGNGAAPAETPVAATNGHAAAVVSPAQVVSAAPPTPAEEVDDPEAAARAEMNRREFLMYSWGAALGLLTLQAGVASFLFMYPRFRAGEFGGKFFVSPTDFGTPTSSPVGETAGKFWMITTAAGEPKAIYMVCTHLGCLYKWVEANNRFECPCHGSKFDREGHFIEGPAPRSLDFFEVTEENGMIAVNTGRKINGEPAGESPARHIVGTRAPDAV